MIQSTFVDLDWTVLRLEDESRSLQMRFETSEYELMSEQQRRNHWIFLENKIQYVRPKNEPIETCNSYGGIAFVSRTKKFRVRLCKNLRWHSGNHKYALQDVILTSTQQLEAIKDNNNE